MASSQQLQQLLQQQNAEYVQTLKASIVVKDQALQDARALSAQLQNSLTAELDAANKTIAEKDAVKQQQNAKHMETVKAMRASIAEKDQTLTAKRTELDAANTTIVERDVAKQQQNADHAQTLNAMQTALDRADVTIAEKERAMQDARALIAQQKQKEKNDNLVPEIVSIADNENGAVNLRWRLVQATQATHAATSHDLRIGLALEYAEDEKALESGDKSHSRVLDVAHAECDKVYEARDIAVDDISASVFRLQWRKCSNAKTMRMKKWDQWDMNAKGQWIAVDKNVIKHTGNGRICNSVYGKVVCKSPHTYHWRFRIKTYAEHFMFGVAKMSNGDKWKNTNFGSYEVGYHACGGTTYAIIHTAGTGQSQYNGHGYGGERLSKSGDVLDMYLDLKEYTLSFKTGGQDTGVCIRNLPREHYRMIVSLNRLPIEIELVAFNCN